MLLVQRLLFDFVPGVKRMGNRWAPEALLLVSGREGRREAEGEEDGERSESSTGWEDGDGGRGEDVGGDDGTLAKYSLIGTRMLG